MNKLLFSILFSLSIHLCAQTDHEGLQFSRTEFLFSKVENWVSRIDTVEVTNLTEKRIFLLKQKYPREFEVRFSSGPIEPGKTAFLEIVYKPSEKGKFNTSIQVYHSASQTPVIITYKGEVRSFDEFAEVACPSFSTPNLKPIDVDLEIRVIDSLTQKPLGNSFLEITKGEFYSQHSSDNNGLFKQKATINYYIVLAEHPGYRSKYVAQHVNPKNRKITIELSPLEQYANAHKDTFTVIQPRVPPVLPETKPGFSLADYKRNNIVFLIDKSSSMNKPDCMPFLQMAMTQLATISRSEDRITLITYANEAKVVLPGTQGNEHEKIFNVINQLKCGGRTEGGKAIHTAYQNAEANFIKGGVNQIVVATDGGFNGLSENEAELMQLVEAKAKEGITLSVLAFGQNRFGKALITRLAKQGEGFYLFIANPEDAQVKLTEIIKLRSKAERGND